jgi:hypothetical protein
MIQPVACLSITYKFKSYVQVWFWPLESRVLVNGLVLTKLVIPGKSIAKFGAGHRRHVMATKRISIARFPCIRCFAAAHHDTHRGALSIGKAPDVIGPITVGWRGWIENYLSLKGR